MTNDRFVVSTVLGRWQTNCYIVGDRQQSTAVIVDPGEHGAQVVPKVIDALDVSVEAILLTHGHLDHFWAVPELARTFNVDVYLHGDDRWLWDDPAAGFGGPPQMLEAEFGLAWSPPTQHLRTIQDGENLVLAGTTFRVAHTPGHTPGHCTFLARQMAGASLALDLAPQQSLQRTDLDAELSEANDVLLSGDLIFAGSIGRTDFPRGSFDAIMQSLAESVLTLADDTLILPGHGPTTLVARERATNQYLREAAARQG